MDEQSLRNEIEAARDIRFPSDPLLQKKAILRDLYYVALNNKKILCVNSPDDKKEEHIQSVLEIFSTIEQIEQEIISEEPSWQRPEAAIVDLTSSPLLLSGITSSASTIGSYGYFSNKLYVNDLPVAAQSWPVGSVFISITPDNPAELLGFGTWVGIASGRMLVGVDPGDPDFDSSEKIGGEKEVVLTEEQIPEHNHEQLPHNHVLTGGITDDTSAPYLGPDAAKSANSPFSAGILPALAENLPAGGGQPHNNLPPYFTVYIFKREA